MLERQHQKKMPEHKEGDEKLRDFHDLVLCTTTLYKNDEQSRVREKLGLHLLENASRLGIRAIVVDAGSNTAFLEAARSLRGIHVVEELPGQTMGAGRRQALDEALKVKDASVFLWVEPEKDTLINELSLGDMVQEIKSGRADIVVPRRADQSSMPTFQKWIENRANKRASALLPVDEEGEHQALDVWFGPKMFNRENAGYFANYPGHNIDHWDATIRPVIDAAKDGKKIASVNVAYSYDPSQRDAEENDRNMKMKRVDQYRQVLAALDDKLWKREGKGLEKGKPKNTRLE